MPKAKKKEKLIPLFKEKQDFFTSLAESQSLRHAYLFFGDEGIGKFTFAKQFAGFLETGEFLESVRPLVDTYVIEPDEDGKISVDTARTLKNFLSQKPIRSQKRTAIVRCAESLTPEAQAACLKIVEEPPASALIIFTAKASEAFFPPLASRMLKIYFPRMSRKKLADFLVSNYAVSSENALKTSSRSHGRIGLAESILKDKKKKAPNFSVILSEKISSLRDENLEKNAEILSRLLRMQELLLRYNLNERVQEKAFKFLISNF